MCKGLQMYIPPKCLMMYLLVMVYTTTTTAAAAAAAAAAGIYEYVPNSLSQISYYDSSLLVP
jgi:hypothetical protein